MFTQGKRLTRAATRLFLVSILIAVYCSASARDLSAQEIMRFAVIGDYGSGDGNEADVANLVKSWNPDFIITTGDNNYPDGEASTIDNNIGRFYAQYSFHTVAHHIKSKRVRVHYIIVKGAGAKKIVYE